MNNPDLELEFEQVENLVVIDVMLQGRHIGSLRATESEQDILVGDIHVKEEIEHPRTWFLPSWWPKRTPMRPRGQGAGRMMMSALIDFADDKGLPLVGGVTVDDLTRTPFLLKWYERLGFQVTEGAPSFLSCAAYTVVRPANL
jgi:GNAT superfamily N-acetyltransferase